MGLAPLGMSITKGLGSSPSSTRPTAQTLKTVNHDMNGLVSICQYDLALLCWLSQQDPQATSSSCNQLCCPVLQVHCSLKPKCATSVMHQSHECTSHAQSPVQHCMVNLSGWFVSSLLKGFTCTTATLCEHVLPTLRLVDSVVLSVFL